MVVNKVAADSHADSVRIGFLRTVVGADAEVGWFFAFWQLMGLNEVDGFSAFDGAIFSSLSKAGDFFRAACFPFQFVGSLEEVAVFF